MRRFSFRPALTLKGRKFHWLRGFDGKPFHPPLTDVPSGAYVIAPALDLVSFFGRNKSWADEVFLAAGFVFLAGAIVSVATAITGFADWLDTEKGTQIRRMASAHGITMVFMTLLVLANLGLRFLGPELAYPTTAILLLSAATFVLIIAGGTIGGSMVYDYGFNVQTSQDNPVYHRHEDDILDPHDKPKDSNRTIRLPKEAETESRG